MGNFQASVGRLSGDFGEVKSWLVFVALVAVGIGVGIQGERGELFLGNPSAKGEKNSKPAPPWVGWAICAALFGFGVLTVIFWRWWNRLEHSNKTVAEIGGTAAEIDFASLISS